MVLADALSRWPDLCPVEDHDNENVVLLPEDLFVALIDVELRDAVAKLQQEDSIALEALRLLTELNSLTPSLNTDGWTTEVDSTRSKVLFYKGKIYIPQDMELRLLDILEYWKPTWQFHKNIGGWVCELLFAHTWMAVLNVNNSKSTDLLQNLPCSPFPLPWQTIRLLSYPWISSPAYRFLTFLILSWSW